jgi:hypothetical protein
LHEVLQDIDAKIAHYLHELDAADTVAAAVQQTTTEVLREKIQPLRERQGRSEGLRHTMAASGESQVSLTNPDSRAMPKNSKVNVGYNTQIAVDERHQLVIAQEVTRPSLPWISGAT